MDYEDWLEELIAKRENEEECEDLDAEIENAVEEEEEDCKQS